MKYNRKILSEYSENTLPYQDQSQVGQKGNGLRLIIIMVIAMVIIVIIEIAMVKIMMIFVSR